jgi:hypothetical protein
MSLDLSLNEPSDGQNDDRYRYWENGIVCAVKVGGLVSITSLDVAVPPVTPATAGVMVGLATGAMVSCSIFVAESVARNSGGYSSTPFIQAKSSTDIFSWSGAIGAIGDSTGNEKIRDLAATAKGVEVVFSVTEGDPSINKFIDNVTRIKELAERSQEKGSIFHDFTRSKDFGRPIIDTRPYKVDYPSGEDKEYHCVA